MRRCFAIIFVLTWGLAFTARAQPADVTRVLRTFDFEERKFGNVEDLPMNWAKVEGPGNPHYVNGRLVTERFHSGNHSFRFDLNGGSLVYRYESGLLTARPDAHYRIEAFAQTTTLPNARARISAFFTDLDHHPINATTRHGEPFVSTASPATSAAGGADPWTKLTVELTATDPKCAFLVIELELLQAEQYASTSLGKQALFPQDIHGSAWFDDVSVSQVPQVSMDTHRPGNIFHRSDSLRIEVTLNDRFTDDLSAKLTVRDAPGNVVYQKSGALDMTAAEVLGPGRKRTALALPDLPAGWYSAELAMSSGGQFVGSQKLDFLRLADDSQWVQPDPRFGLVATDLPFAAWDELPEVLDQLGAGRVKLGVWTSKDDVDHLPGGTFDRLLDKLQESRIEPTACLVDLPPDIAKRVNGTSWLQLLAAKKQDWQPQLAFLISRHASRLHRWQLAADGSDAFIKGREMRTVYKALYGEFSALVDKPDLAIPWPAWYELDDDLPPSLALHIKPDVLPAQLPLYLQDLKTHAGDGHSVFIEPLDSAAYGREAQIRDFAQRFAYVMAADVKRIDLKLPFAFEKGESSAARLPSEMMLVIRTLMTTLSGAKFKGKVPVAENVEAFLFDRGGTGILMLWDRGSDGGVRPLAVNLAKQALRLDLWGNASPVIRSSSSSSKALGGDDSSSVPIEVGPMPVFLVGIDAQVAQLRASVALDNDKIESSFKPHTRKIRFTNPYKQAVAGSVRLAGPAGWVVTPPSLTFSLNPGEVFEREIGIDFPYNSFAGPKRIDAFFQVQADGNSSFHVPLTLRLGLSEVGLQTFALRDGRDVIVQQMITNYSDKPLDYTAFAVFPSQARQERLVTGLAAGKTVVKKYRFIEVPAAPGVKVRSGMKEIDGTRMLNDEVEIQ